MSEIAMEQSTKHHNKDIRVEDQTDVPSVVRRLQAQASKMQRHHAEEVIALQCENDHLREAYWSWQPEANPPKGGKVELTAVGLPRATNLSVCSDTIPSSLNTLGKQLLQFKNPCLQHHGGDFSFQLEELDHREVWWYHRPERTPRRAYHAGELVNHG